jgi:magnesium transporter
MITVFAVTRGHEHVTTFLPNDVPALLADPAAYVWVDIAGPRDAEAEALLREVFHFHPLAVEDCFEARAHPKIEAYDDHLFVITHGMWRGSTAEASEVVELDAFLGKRCLVTHHTQESRSVAQVVAAVSGETGVPTGVAPAPTGNGGAVTLRRGPAAVLHAILDRQIDGIEPTLEEVEARLEGLEDRIFSPPRREDLETLLALKRTTLQFRRWMVRQREVLLRLSRNELDLFSRHEGLLFRDAHDHLVRFVDLVESQRELAASLQDTMLSVSNIRLGEIMKYLTVFTAALMPMTVVSGIFGMNFEVLPGSRHPVGFHVTVALMVFAAVGVLAFFRRKGWVARELPKHRHNAPGPAKEDA